MSKMPHIQLDRSICASAAILPGDPARVDAVAAFLTDVHEEGFSREYKSITGTYRGRRVLVISTGMGGASTAICAEELADLGVTDMIRIGSCGALQSSLSLGQLVLCSHAVCDDGTSQSYLNWLRYASDELADNPRFFTERAGVLSRENIQPENSLPSTFDPGLRCAAAAPSLLGQCVRAAQELKLPYAVGATRCHDALYLSAKPALDEFYSGKGVLASDMETAALFAVGAVRQVRTASILNVVVEWKKSQKEGIASYKNGDAPAIAGEKNEILLALESLLI